MKIQPCALGVLTLPGSRFGSATHHFRLGFGRRDLPVALMAFERQLRQPC